MSLTIDTSNQNSKAIVNLLNLVDRRKWSLHFVFVSSSPHCGYDLTAEDIATVVDAVTDIAPTLGRLVANGVVTLLQLYILVNYLSLSWKPSLKKSSRDFNVHDQRLNWTLATAMAN